MRKPTQRGRVTTVSLSLRLSFCPNATQPPRLPFSLLFLSPPLVVCSYLSLQRRRSTREGGSWVCLSLYSLQRDHTKSPYPISFLSLSPSLPIGPPLPLPPPPFRLPSTPFPLPSSPSRVSPRPAAAPRSEADAARSHGAAAHAPAPVQLRYARFPDPVSFGGPLGFFSLSISFLSP